ncbi:ABC transporter permease [Ferrovibrio sp.]|uniref:ABC transporter permease n=1 Tax=Ferrovibrio sp. TaxID=1917215 RepID=UPI003D269CEE
MTEVTFSPNAAPQGLARRGHGRLAWTLFAAVLALLIAAPLLAVLANLGRPTQGVFAHLAATVLPEMLLNTVLLLLGVGLGSALIGVGCAWAVTMIEFPGRRLLSWLLFLPLAIPGYVSAFVYGELMQFAGPVQTALRQTFGWSRGDYWFPDVMTLGGVTALLTLAFYPYVYMLARAAFQDQSVCVLEVGRTLGIRPWGRFWRIALPLARPMIAGGIALVLMETLAEFGAVSYFGVPTFTTAIYRTWFGMGNPVAAAQLAGMLMLFVLGAVMLERISRQAKRFHHTSARTRPLKLHRPTPLLAGLTLLLCALPVLLGFLLPAGRLLYLAITEGDSLGSARLLGFALNSFMLSGLAALLLVGLGLLLAYAQRLAPGRLLSWLGQFATMGYAVPGSVIAIGILLPLASLDHTLNTWMQRLFGHAPGLLLSGTLLALLYAYVVRFMAVTHSTMDGGLHRIRPSLDQAARVLGESPFGVVRRVHAPLLRGSLFTAALLAFVDVLKELPATLIVRPFDFDTLAVRVYQLSSDERLSEASTGALIIVAAGLLPVLWLNAALAGSRPGQEQDTP